MNGQSESSGRCLWLLSVGPVIWIVHFLLSYVTAAIYCAKAAGFETGVAPVRVAVSAYTALALIGLVATGIHAMRRSEPGDAATRRQSRAADRRRFIGSATALLCGLSGLATIYVAAVTLFFESCH